MNSIKETQTIIIEALKAQVIISSYYKNNATEEQKVAIEEELDVLAEKINQVLIETDNKLIEIVGPELIAKAAEDKAGSDDDCDCPACTLRRSLEGMNDSNNAAVLQSILYSKVLDRIKKTQTTKENKDLNC